MVFYNAGYKGRYVMTDNWAPDADTWYHLEFTRNGTGALIFIDGVSQGLDELTAFGTNDVGDLDERLYVGSEEAGTGSYIKGWIDEARISKGVARNTSNFDIPTEEYNGVTEVGQFIIIQN